MDSPLQAQLAAQSALIDTLVAALDAAKVIDAEAVKAEAAATVDDDTLLLSIAKALGMDPAEVAKRRESEPEWWAKVVSVYGPSKDDATAKEIT